jgi:type IV secretory pathway VirB2 component (pilin)
MRIVPITLAALAVAAFPDAAAAATVGGLPWESTFQTVVNSLSGPVVTMGSVGAIALSGAAMAFNEGGPVVRTAIKSGFGLSCATGAASLVSTLWGVTPGATF